MIYNVEASRDPGIVDKSISNKHYHQPGVFEDQCRTFTNDADQFSNASSK